MRVALLLVCLGLLSACVPIAIGQPDWVTDRRLLPSCGVERLGPEGGMDREARRCLLAVWESGEDAELITALTTVEGDLTTRYLRVHADGTIELFVDATQDALGSGRWERLRCDTLSPVDAEQGGDHGLVFTEHGCEPVPVP